MAITIDSTLNLDQVGLRVRILTGVSVTELGDSTLSENAVVFYACYLASIAQNGIGLEQIRIGDVFVQYNDDEPYDKFLAMAKDALHAKISSSIKTTTYNADAAQGDIDWKKNIDGSDSTLNVRQKPRGM